MLMPIPGLWHVERVAENDGYTSFHLAVDKKRINAGLTVV